MATASGPLEEPPSLLLLPASPCVPRAVYHAPLAAVLIRLSNEHRRRAAACTPPQPPPPPALVVVAIATPVLAGPSPRARLVYWRRAQALLAETYALIASIAAEHAIATDLGSCEPGSVDARIILVDYDGTGPSPGPGGRQQAVVVPDLARFASTLHPWSTVYYPTGGPGEELLAAYTALAEGHQTLQQNTIVVVDGVSDPTPHSPTTENGGGGDLEVAVEDAVRGYSTVSLGGTFDHLHPGHKLLLHAAALLLHIPDDDAPTPSRKPAVLIVGVSGDELLTKKQFADELQEWDARARSVIEFLATVLAEAPTTSTPSVTTTMSAIPSASGTSPKELHATFCNGGLLVRCVYLCDPFGPTITEESVDAIVVSGETRSGGQAINDRRKDRGWKGLDMYEIDVLDAIDGTDETATSAKPADSFAAKISSTEIRKKRAQARKAR
ncbi:hypothetical protein DCS_04742 [Drechmeria coniospora]|uniref:Pantetheine-phosphate adenylyltransferase family protein n=1 Tax=Drechmeria coniospora TaxID=98403 RepID=A0A151GKW5_DRECN|nr:hypothetical protein DCS_04742 [Drechmeria coniospora]KYK57729.1 hypothetical protein DCS_04742 [Drechmeria coniospora]